MSGAKARCLYGNKSLTTVDKVLYGHTQISLCLLDSGYMRNFMHYCTSVCLVCIVHGTVLEYSSRPDGIIERAHARQY